MAGQSEDALEYRLIKMTATGTILWNKTYGGNREDHCFGLDLGEDGSIFFTRPVSYTHLTLPTSDLV